MIKFRNEYSELVRVYEEAEEDGDGIDEMAAEECIAAFQKKHFPKSSMKTKQLNFARKWLDTVVAPDVGNIC